MSDPTGVAKGLGDLAVKVKDKVDQAESNQSTCKILVSYDMIVMVRTSKA